jgi:hypothetical protein
MNEERFEGAGGLILDLVGAGFLFLFLFATASTTAKAEAHRVLEENPKETTDVLLTFLGR